MTQSRAGPFILAIGIVGLLGAVLWPHIVSDPNEECPWLASKTSPVVDDPLAACLDESNVEAVKSKRSYPARVPAAGQTKQEAVVLSKLPPFTEAELKMYAGNATNQAILLSVGGLVFNVTEKGKDHYGYGGAYHAFAGHACTRGVVLPSLKPEDINDDCEDFTDEQLAKKAEWIGFFRGKYPTVGRLMPDEDAKRRRQEGKQRALELTAVGVAAKKKQVGRVYTLQELATHDGTDPSLPTLLAVSGHVLDISSAPQFFGIGAERQIYAGKEISRALALVSPRYTPGVSDMNADTTGLSEEQLQKMRQSVDYFLSRFPKMGELVG
jgi:predicted heme/steroid binding protein